MQTRNWSEYIKAALMGGTLLGVSLTSVVQNNEGYSEKAYYDSANIATICYGETKGVKIGDKSTKAQCDKQLVESLTSHSAALNGLPSNITDVMVLGVADMSYNIGVNGFNKSSVKKAIIGGDWKRAGELVLDWKYITYKGQKYDCSVKGNKVCYGLWVRRQWQSKAIGNEFKTPQEAIHALPK